MILYLQKIPFFIPLALYDEKKIKNPFINQIDKTTDFPFNG